MAQNLRRLQREANLQLRTLGVDRQDGAVRGLFGRDRQEPKGVGARGCNQSGLINESSRSARSPCCPIMCWASVRAGRQTTLAEYECTPPRTLAEPYGFQMFIKNQGTPKNSKPCSESHGNANAERNIKHDSTLENVAYIYICNILCWW